MNTCLLETTSTCKDTCLRIKKWPKETHFTKMVCNAPTARFFLSSLIYCNSPLINILNCGWCYNEWWCLILRNKWYAPRPTSNICFLTYWVVETDLHHKVGWFNILDNLHFNTSKHSSFIKCQFSGNILKWLNITTLVKPRKNLFGKFFMIVDLKRSKSW